MFHNYQNNFTIFELYVKDLNVYFIKASLVDTIYINKKYISTIFYNRKTLKKNLRDHSICTITINLRSNKGVIEGFWRTCMGNGALGPPLALSIEGKDRYIDLVQQMSLRERQE